MTVPSSSILYEQRWAFRPLDGSAGCVAGPPGRTRYPRPAGASFYPLDPGP